MEEKRDVVIEELRKYGLVRIEEAGVCFTDSKERTIEISNDLLKEEYANSVEEFVRDVVSSIECMRESVSSFDEVDKSKLCMHLVSEETAMSYEVKRRYMNMSLVYTYSVNVKDTNVTLTKVVDKMLLNKWAITEDELQEIAEKATLDLYEWELKDFNELFGVPSKEGSFMSVIRSKPGLQGAVILFYKEALKRLLKERGFKKVVVIPSSIFEVIIVDALTIPESKLEGINSMVREVNVEQVAAKERLAERAFVFDVDSLKLEIIK